MVGRPSKASLLLLAAAAAAAVGASRPAAAQPQRLLFDLPTPAAATLAPSISTAPANPGASITPSAPADLADAEILDPTEAAAEPLPPVAAPLQAPLPPVARQQPLDSGELGIEYQLSVHDAESFLDRLAARWKRLVEQAMTYLGTPYRRGGTSRRGLDCSGLVGAVYGEQGLELPRTAAEQFREGAPVLESDLRPGDLVFFRDTYKRGISHVGIYIGDGRFLHAAGRRHGVIVSELSRPYYQLRFAGARRPAPDPAAADRQGSQQAASGAAPVATAAATLAAAPR